jgi:hypothetical protein
MVFSELLERQLGRLELPKASVGQSGRVSLHLRKCSVILNKLVSVRARNNEERLAAVVVTFDVERDIVHRLEIRESDRWMNLLCKCHTHQTNTQTNLSERNNIHCLRFPFLFRNPEPTAPFESVE